MSRLQEMGFSPHSVKGVVDCLVCLAKRIVRNNIYWATTVFGMNVKTRSECKIYIQVMWPSTHFWVSGFSTSIECEYCKAVSAQIPSTREKYRPIPGVEAAWLLSWVSHSWTSFLYLGDTRPPAGCSISSPRPQYDIPIVPNVTGGETRLGKIDTLSWGNANTVTFFPGDMATCLGIHIYCLSNLLGLKSSVTAVNWSLLEWM